MISVNGTNYLSYWKPDTVKKQNEPLLSHAASDQYHHVKAGDTIWIVTAWPPGRLVLVGRIRVVDVTDQTEAERRRAGKDTWRAKYHIFPANDEAEPLREIELSDIAPSLRFESKRDHLNVKNGHVDAKQLQTMRRLTPQSSALLLSLWNQDFDLASAIQEGDTNDDKAAGFGTAALNKEVEKSAIDRVSRLLRKEGWVVESKESLRIGFDLLCQRGKEQRHVEVKGVRGTEANFLITAAELQRARQDPLFWIYIVTMALSPEPIIKEMSGNQVVDRYRFDPLVHRAVLK